MRGGLGSRSGAARGARGGGDGSGKVMDAQVGLEVVDEDVLIPIKAFCAGAC